MASRIVQVTNADAAALYILANADILYCWYNTYPPGGFENTGSPCQRVLVYPEPPGTGG